MFALVLLLAAPAAAQSPIYLQCTFPVNGAVLEITADEGNGVVTTVLKSSGFSQRLSAAFTPNEVRFGDRQLSYVLSRTDLTITRTINLIADTDTGVCKIVVPPKRAF